MDFCITSSSESMKRTSLISLSTLNSLLLCEACICSPEKYWVDIISGKGNKAPQKKIGFSQVFNLVSFPFLCLDSDTACTYTSDPYRLSLGRNSNVLPLLCLSFDE